MKFEDDIKLEQLDIPSLMEIIKEILENYHPCKCMKCEECMYLNEFNLKAGNFRYDMIHFIHNFSKERKDKYDNPERISI